MTSDVTAFIVSGLTKQGAVPSGQSDLLPQSLSALGLDSLDFMELLDDIEEEFDVRIEDDTVSASTTVAELIAFVEGKAAARKAGLPLDRA
jgi:acyl carrier protein